MVRRRTFLIALAAIAASGGVHGQSSRKIYRIGIVAIGSTADLAGARPASPTARALISGLRDLGYVYGQHYVTEARGAEGKPERYAAFAAELVGLDLDLIVAVGPALQALTWATSSIPIIMTATNDPVAEGYVDSLARPGRNLTGFSLQSIETTGKQVELIKEMVPGGAPLAVVWNGSGVVNLREAESVARMRGWRILPVEIREVADVDHAFKAAGKARAGASLAYASSILYPNARQVAAAALKHRMPTAFGLDAFVDAGGLVSYGPDVTTSGGAPPRSSTRS